MKRNVIWVEVEQWEKEIVALKEEEVLLNLPKVKSSRKSAKLQRQRRLQREKQSIASCWLD